MQYTLSGALVGVDFLKKNQQDTFSNSSIEPLEIIQSSISLTSMSIDSKQLTVFDLSQGVSHFVLLLIILEAYII